MGDRITDLNITPAITGPAPDKTFVYTGASPAPTLPEKKDFFEERLESLMGTLPAGERRETLENIKFAIEALKRVLDSSRNAGATEEDVCKALEGFLASGPLGAFPDINPMKPLDATGLPVLLRGLDADKEPSSEWIVNVIKAVGAKLAAPKENNAFFSIIEKELPMTRDEKTIRAKIGEKVGFVAELAYIMQQKGLKPMGDYAEDSNDCFDFCQWVYAIALGIPFSKALVTQESNNGGLSAYWFITPQEEQSLPEKSPSEIMSLREDAIKRLESGAGGNGSFLKVFSITGVTKQHWGVLCNRSFVIDFTGKGIGKQKLSDFAYSGKTLRWTLNPVEKEGSAEFAQEEPKNPQRIGL